VDPFPITKKAARLSRAAFSFACGCLLLVVVVDMVMVMASVVVTMVVVEAMVVVPIVMVVMHGLGVRGDRHASEAGGQGHREEDFLEHGRALIRD
jgi:hypothetical protein